MAAMGRYKPGKDSRSSGKWSYWWLWIVAAVILTVVSMAAYWLWRLYPSPAAPNLAEQQQKWLASLMTLVGFTTVGLSVGAAIFNQSRQLKSSSKLKAVELMMSTSLPGEEMGRAKGLHDLLGGELDDKFVNALSAIHKRGPGIHPLLLETLLTKSTREEVALAVFVWLSFNPGDEESRAIRRLRVLLDLPQDDCYAVCAEINTQWVEDLTRRSFAAPRISQHEHKSVDVEQSVARIVASTRTVK